MFLTEVQHRACALNIPICPTGTMMVSPGGLSGILHCFRQLPGTPGEANESAPGLGSVDVASQLAGSSGPIPYNRYFNGTKWVFWLLLGYSGEEKCYGYFYACKAIVSNKLWLESVLPELVHV